MLPKNSEMADKTKEMLGNEAPHKEIVLELARIQAAAGILPSPEEDLSYYVNMIKKELEKELEKES